MKMWVRLFVFVGMAVASVAGVSFEEDVTITREQKVAIDKLKKRVLPYINENYMKEDIYLVKWLRSTDFDVNTAEKKFISNVKWRKENKIAGILEEDFSDIANDYPYLDNIFDKEGRPSFIAFAGEWDIRDGVVTGRVPRGLRYLTHALENLAVQIRKLQQDGKNVTQANLVIELSGFSMVQHACVQCLMVIINFLNIYEAHYTGVADKVLFVDAPPSVQFVIQTIKQNVNKQTRDAITVYGRNKAQWQAVLRKYIDMKYLPIELGGTLEWNSKGGDDRRSGK